MSMSSIVRDPTVVDLMLKLSFVTYAGNYRLLPFGANRAVKKLLKKLAPEQEPVWGPQSSGNVLDLFTTTLAFIVKENEDDGIPPVYTLVIRGTNAMSWSSVVVQDLAVHNMTPWKLVSPNAVIARDSTPAIYEGAGRTLEYLNALKHGGKTILQFLLDKVAEENATIRITGHSLGGMATAMYSVWLQEEFKAAGVDIKGRLAVWPVAGLTPGNVDFASHAEALFTRNRNDYLRIVNDLDFATKAWLQNSLGTEVPVMYAPTVKLSDLDRSIIQLFYNISLNRDYAHLKKHMLVPAELAPIKSWFLQFVYQHFYPYLDYLQNPEDRAALIKMLGLEMLKHSPASVARLALGAPKLVVGGALSLWKGDHAAPVVPEAVAAPEAS